MMVPAVCDACHAFFPSGFNIAGGASFAGCASGPCPRCGGMGHIPDGTYEFIDNSIRLLSGPERSRQELTMLADILRTARERGATLQELRAEVREKAPELLTCYRKHVVSYTRSSESC